MEVLDSQQRGLGWGLGAAQLNQLSVKATTKALIQLYQLLLFSMPGIPVFTYGDEIGLAKQVGPGAEETLKGFANVTVRLTPVCFLRV